ncbi:hypothetical protein, partial [Bifidobacterium scardovii]|uniref:hypothetical protein n=1 Tax=Bifidobacterium scardovii TaxID=158787 RepID=UPI00254A0C59
SRNNHRDVPGVESVWVTACFSDGFNAVRLSGVESGWVTGWFSDVFNAVRLSGVENVWVTGWFSDTLYAGSSFGVENGWVNTLILGHAVRNNSIWCRTCWGNVRFPDMSLLEDGVDGHPGGWPSTSPQ